MPETPAIPVVAWSDPFTTPTRERLVAGVADGARPSLTAVLDALTSRKGCRPRIEWMGLPWRWTIVIGHSGLAHPDLAYVIAAPERPLLCIPVATSGEHAPATDRLTKPVRQILDRSAIVAGFVWPEWAIADADLVALEPLLAARAGA